MKSVSIRLTDEEHKEIVEAAKKDKRSFNAYVLTQTLRGVRSQK